MDTKTRLLNRTLGALVVLGIALVHRPADAATYNLRAAAKLVTMSDGTQVQMWGFGLASDPDVSVPGPLLDVPPGDSTLTVNLTNELPVPISIVIPGLPAPLTPVWDDGTTGGRTSLQQRAVSFTHVAQPGETRAYQWTGVRSGTYLYHSGTHPAVQVPMGLYGTVRHDVTAGEAYGAAYDKDAVLVYSEVDPTLNAAVAGGTYGTAAYPTTVDYRPRYFLINGQPASTPPDVEQNVNQRLLLRLVNAGLRSVVPTLSGMSMKLLAEDGQPAPYVHARYSALLSAGKTIDALLQPAEVGAATLFDRRGPSRLARISVVLPQGAPVAAADSYAVGEDATLDTNLAGLPGVLDNDTGTGLSAVLISGPSSGTLQLQPDGSFIYAPNPSFSGVDSFSYQASDGTLTSSAATVTITVTPQNDPPVAADDSYQATEGTPLVIAAPGVLGNDSDVDLDALQAQIVSGPSGGSLTLNLDGSLQYTANAGTTQDSFTYQAIDGSLPSNTATVTISVLQPANASPVAQDDYASTPKNTAVIIDVLANDSDADGSIAPSTVVVVSQPTRGGTATSMGNGTVQFVPKNNFKGTDTFTYVVSDNLGAVSDPATVRVNVLK